jgi:hypothetical protein
LSRVYRWTSGLEGHIVYDLRKLALEPAQELAGREVVCILRSKSPDIVVQDKLRELGLLEVLPDYGTCGEF